MSVVEDMLEKSLIQPRTMAPLLAALRHRLDRDGETPTLLRTAAATARGLGDLAAAAGFYDRLAACAPDDIMAPRLAALLRGRPDPVAAPGPDLPPLPFILLPDILSETERATLWDLLDGRDGDWAPTRIYGAAGPELDVSKRHSIRLTGDEAIRALIAPRIDALVAACAAPARLGLRQVEPAMRELHVVSHLDGGKFVLHRDPGGTCLNRTLTYVYYFHRQPRRFSGGELVLFDASAQDHADGPPPAGGHTGLPVFTRLTPMDNSLLLFNSLQLHGVQPVHCDSAAPRDGRLAITGWYHRPVMEASDASP